MKTPANKAVKRTAMGFTDMPVSKKKDDIFGVEKYIKGISSFILDCATPMTMAVQGDWGSGKTSFMELIQEEIRQQVLPVWFNTWQFSQFNLGDQLPIMLVSKLSASLNVKSEKGTEMKNSLHSLSTIAFHLGLSAADRFSGLNVSGALENVYSKESEDITEVITKLKTQFQDCINGALKEQQKDRVVIFVDDLDRLQPARAIELLEVLKLFLDCDNCVFLLAIDYEVVSHGIRQKYGEMIGEDKGRSFFDKIIQVPFKMPVAHYNIENYVKTAMEQMSLPVSNAVPYVELIKASIGYNPRGIKRLLNAFLLLQRIHDDESLDKEYEKLLLFAVLCLQLSYEEIYNYIVRNRSQITPEFFENLCNPDNYNKYLNIYDENNNSSDEILDTVLTEVFDAWNVNSQTDINKAVDFMKQFRNALADNQECLTEDNLNHLMNILSFAAVTASPDTGSLVSANGITGLGVRYKNILDETASWHSIDEHIEYGGKEKSSGWNNSELEAYRLFDNEKTLCKNYTNMLCQVLGLLYKSDPEKFTNIQKNAEDYKLSILFNGVGGKINTPANIPGTDINIETKTMTHQKISDLKKLMSAMKKDPKDLSLLVKLAHRAYQSE